MKDSRGEIVVRAKTFQKIVDHLEQALQDPRKRERTRAKVALEQIKKWHQESEVEWYSYLNSIIHLIKES